MKPFNLEAALAGAKVVTRHGYEVTSLTLFLLPEPYLPLRGVVHGEYAIWTKDGFRHSPSLTSGLDLFMADNDTHFWVARVSDGLRLGTYRTRKECQMAHPDADGYHKIKWREADETV
jgi:hypothetical protein